MNYILFENSSNRFPCKSIDWCLQDVTHIQKKRDILIQAIKRKIFKYKFFQLANAVQR